MSTALVSPTIFDLSEVLCKVRAPPGGCSLAAGALQLVRGSRLAFCGQQRLWRRARAERGRPVGGAGSPATRASRLGRSGEGEGGRHHPVLPARRAAAPAAGGMVPGPDLSLPPGPPRCNTPGRGAARRAAALPPRGRAGSLPAGLGRPSPGRGERGGGGRAAGLPFPSRAAAAPGGLSQRRAPASGALRGAAAAAAGACPASGARLASLRLSAGAGVGRPGGLGWSGGGG